MANLNVRHQRFIEEYLKDFNQTRAYMTAFNNDNYQSCAASANKLLKNPKIKQAIQEIIDEENEKIKYMRWRLIDDTYKKAFSDITQIIKIKKNVVVIKDFDDLTEEQKRLVKGIKEGKNGIEIEFIDQHKEKEFLNKLLNEKEERENGLNTYDTSSVDGLTIDQLLDIVNQDVHLEGEDDEDEE